MSYGLNGDYIGFWAGPMKGYMYKFSPGLIYIDVYASIHLHIAFRVFYIHIYIYTNTYTHFYTRPCETLSRGPRLHAPGTSKHGSILNPRDPKSPINPTNTINAINL